jgi:hypothetical protein
MGGLMDNSANNGTIPVMTQEPYKGESPQWAALGAGLIWAAIMTPVTWATNGVVNLLFDRMREKIPFKEKIWSRFNKINIGSGILYGVIFGLGIRDIAKDVYQKAEEAESQHNQLAFENQMFRKQLTEAGVKPNAIQCIHRTVHPALGDDAQTTPPAHAAKLEAARAAEALAAATSPSTAIH